jgi:hypothetical protein
MAATIRFGVSRGKRGTDREGEEGGRGTGRGDGEGEGACEGGWKTEGQEGLVGRGTAPGWRMGERGAVTDQNVMGEAMG